MDSGRCSSFVSSFGGSIISRKGLDDEVEDAVGTASFGLWFDDSSITVVLCDVLDDYGLSSNLVTRRGRDGWKIFYF